MHSYNKTTTTKLPYFKPLKIAIILNLIMKLS